MKFTFAGDDQRPLRPGKGLGIVTVRAIAPGQIGQHKCLARSPLHGATKGQRFFGCLINRIGAHHDESDQKRIITAPTALHLHRASRCNSACARSGGSVAA